MALAEKKRESGVIVIVFMGDGALGEGVVYESLNLAGLWQLPILFVVENNRVAQTTPIETHLAGSIANRFSAFGITTEEHETSDVCAIQTIAGGLIQKVHKVQTPQALILHTWRFGPHSKGDDPRPAEILAYMRKMHDPITLCADNLDPAACTQVAQQAAKEIESAYLQALNDPPAC
jgi:TPP-dependent pyruvate/acetoin dehydrogenase alpha subunit